MVPVGKQKRLHNSSVGLVGREPADITICLAFSSCTSVLKFTRGRSLKMAILAKIACLSGSYVSVSAGMEYGRFGGCFVMPIHK